MKVGFIGLGKMGQPMTVKLLEAGHEVTVHSRSPTSRGANSARDTASVSRWAGVTTPRRYASTGRVASMCTATCSACSTTIMRQQALTQSVEQAEQVAPLLKALADPVRLRLVSLIAAAEGGAACSRTDLGRSSSSPRTGHRRPS